MTVLSLPRESVRHILVCHVARIGDTVLTSPSIRLLSEHFPYAQIDFLGHPKRYQVLMHLPYLRRVGAISKRSAPFKGWWSWLAAQFGKAKPYDLAVVWGHDCAIDSFVKRIATYFVMQWHSKSDNINEKINGRIINIGNVPDSLANPHQTIIVWREELLSLGLGIKRSSPNYVDYHVTKTEDFWAKNWLKKQTNLVNPYWVGLVINTFTVSGKIEKYPERELPIESFVTICKEIIKKKPDALFILFGSRVDPLNIAFLQQQLLGKVVVTTDQLLIRQTAAIIANINLYIGGDTGPTHIAAAVGTKSIAFFHCSRMGKQVVSPKRIDNFYIIDHPCKEPNRIFTAPMSEINPNQVLLDVILL